MANEALSGPALNCYAFMTDDPRSKTYREHFRHALSLDKNFEPAVIEEILQCVANDEGLKRVLPSIDARMGQKGDEDRLVIGWECAKLYASERLQFPERFA